MLALLDDWAVMLGVNAPHRNGGRQSSRELISVDQTAVAL
jgi:hypothetical protein